MEFHGTPYKTIRKGLYNIIYSWILKINSSNIYFKIWYSCRCSDLFWRQATAPEGNRQEKIYLILSFRGIVFACPLKFLVVVHGNGKGSTRSVGVWGVWEKLKNIYPHHYHAGLPNFLRISLLVHHYPIFKINGSIRSQSIYHLPKLY